jgi:hypothetical protein
MCIMLWNKNKIKYLYNYHDNTACYKGIVSLPIVTLL